MRRMWKRFSKRSWRNSLPLLNTTHRRSKTTRRMLSLPRAGRPLPIMRIQMNIAGERGSRKVYFLSLSRVGCATANTSARSRNSLVSSVVGSLPILITSVSRKAELYCAGRATNSLSRCAEDTIENCIAGATRSHGGNVMASMHSEWHARFGSNLIR